MATLEAGRALLQERRLAVPFPLIRMVERGLERPVGARGTEGWWRWVESRMHRFVRGQLPRGATCVRLALDEDTLDVIVHFRSAGPGSAPLRRADPSPNG